MSYDLCVFHIEEPMSYQRGLEVYWRFCEETDEDDREPVAAVEAFHAELTDRFPEIDDVPEEELEDCPWTCGQDRGPTHVIIPIRFSMMHEVAPFVKDLARKYELACIDPQAETILLPPRFGSATAETSPARKRD